MASRHPAGVISRLSERTDGVFRGADAMRVGVTRKQLYALVGADALERVLPDTYRMTAVARSPRQRLRAALLWAGSGSAAAVRSAGETYGLEGVRASQPEIATPDSFRGRAQSVIVHRYDVASPLMLRNAQRAARHGSGSHDRRPRCGAHKREPRGGMRRCSTSWTHVRHSAAALPHGPPGSARCGSHSCIARRVDPVHPSRSTLEVKTRRLLVGHGIRDFVREFPLDSNGRTYYFDFAFQRERVILETNGRRWHDDPTTTRKTTRNGAFPPGTATGSCSPRGTR